MEVMNEIISQLAKDVNKKRQDQIEERLSAIGHTFETPSDLFLFAKERLTIATYQDKPFYREIFIDFGTDKQMLIATWYDTVEPDFSDPSKISVVAGKPAF